MSVAFFCFCNDRSVVAPVALVLLPFAGKRNVPAANVIGVSGRGKGGDVVLTFGQALVARLLVKQLHGAGELCCYFCHLRVIVTKNKRGVVSYAVFINY